MTKQKPKTPYQPEREQRARDAVVRAATRWVRRCSFLDDAALSRAVNRLAKIQKEKKRAR